jgi:hypothetical protein
MEDGREYAILGIHDKDVLSVEGEVVRVRMFVGDQVIDEDFPLPTVLTMEELLDIEVQKRLSELKSQAAKPTDAS